MTKKVKKAKSEPVTGDNRAGDNGDGGNGKVAEAQEPEALAQDAVKQLEPLELERFCRFEAEIRTCVQGIRIADLELLELKRTLAAKANEAQQRKNLLENELNRRWKLGYDAFCMTLAEKYGIPKPARMLIDTDAGTIRDAGEV